MPDTYLSSLNGLGAKSLEEIHKLKILVESTTNIDCNIKNISPLNDYRQKELLVINIAFPEKINLNISKILFKTKNGLLLEDAPLTDFNLPIRCINAFNNINIYSIKPVSLYPIKNLKNIRNLGETTINFLAKYLHDITEIECTNLDKNEIILKGYNEYSEQLKIQLQNFNLYFIYEKILIELNDFIHEKYKNIPNPNDVLNKEFFKTYVLNSIIIKKTLTNHIFNIISNSSDIITKDNLKLAIPNILLYDELIDKLITTLLTQKLIESYKTGYRIYRPYFKDWVQTLKPNQKLAVTYRVQNKTLNECGTLLGNMTRERARQLICKATLNKPKLKEDEFEYWFKKYYFTYETMNTIFKITLDNYNYLKGIYDRGKLSIEDMVNDEQITPEFKIRLLKYINRNKLLINGEYIQINRHALCRKLAHQICAETEIEISDFYQQYINLLKNYNLINNNKLTFANKRAFEARIQNSMYILMSLGHKIRYYPFNEYDIEEFVNELHLENFKDVEISTYKLISDYPQLMEQYNIKNEYELHNFLNKTQSIWNNNKQFEVVITRMPMISFGNANRRQQTIQLLNQVSPVTSKEFSLFYESEFGVRSATVIANMHKFIEQYYHNGFYEINQQLLLKEEEYFLKNKLIHDFYLISEIKELFAHEFGQEAVSHLNSRCYKLLGFKIYSLFILKNTMHSLSDYFKKLIDNNDDSTITKLMSIDTKVDVLFYNTLNEHLENLNILEYQYKQYVSFKKYNLIHPLCTKTNITDFINYIYEFTTNEFFTIDYLTKQGTIQNTLLYDLGEDSFFYNALLKNSHKFNYIRCAKSFIFYKKNGTTKSSLDFIKYLLNSLRKININDFITYIYTEYGINTTNYKVLSHIVDSDIFYDKYTKILYYTLEDYYLANKHTIDINTSTH